MVAEASSSGGPGEITMLLAKIRQGSAEAESALMPLVYDELRRLARRYLGRERPSCFASSISRIVSAKRPVGYNTRAYPPPPVVTWNPAGLEAGGSALSFKQIVVRGSEAATATYFPEYDDSLKLDFLWTLVSPKNQGSPVLTPTGVKLNH
jgi:hypothetical protein